MGIIALALASYHGWSGDEWHVPLWVVLSAAGAMGLGTAIGGWRIIRTMGLKVVDLRPIDGFAAETAAATVIEIASRLGIPVSTTHTLVGAVLGIGIARGIGALNLGVVGSIFMSWLITLPAGAFLSIIFFTILRAIFV